MLTPPPTPPRRRWFHRWAVIQFDMVSPGRDRVIGYFIYYGFALATARSIRFDASEAQRNRHAWIVQTAAQADAL